MNGTRTKIAPGTTRRAIERKVLAGIIVVALAACGEGTGSNFLTPLRGGGGSGSDTTPPTVVSTNPINFATGVPTNATISATFSELLDSASVTNAAFSFDNGVTGSIVVNGATVTLTPSLGLPPSTTIHGTFSPAIRDRAGNSLAAAATLQFTTSP